MRWVFDEKPIETISVQLCRPLEEMQALGVLSGDRLVSIGRVAESLFKEIEEISQKINITKRSSEDKPKEPLYGPITVCDYYDGPPYAERFANLEECRLEYGISDKIKIVENAQEPTVLIDVCISVFADEARHLNREEDEAIRMCVY